MGLLIKYSEFYGKNIPENPINLIKCIPKEELLATIASINNRLKPVHSSHIDDSRDTQIDCLRTIFLDNKNPPSQSNCKSFVYKFIDSPRSYTLFTRVTCLYAFQEIISSDGFVEETPEYTIEIRENILKFLLIVNENILIFNNEYSDKDREELGDKFFEYFMFKELPHNQYYVSFNSINVFYKSWILFKLLNNDSNFGKHLKNYLKQTFDVDEMSDFFKKQMYSYFQSHDDNLKMQYLNVKKTNIEVIKILDKFSERNNFPLSEKDDLKIFEFLDLKKSPLYKNEGNDGKDIITYLVLDNTLFIEKTYSLFINDFWFDYLKPNNICNRNDWGNFIGTAFFEPFLETIFCNAFQNNRRTVYRSTDDLKFKLNQQNEIEYADFYIREKGKIILAEAKSNYLPFINGYKTVKTIDDYKALDLTKFYKDYGLTQLANKTIKEFHKYKFHINDKDFSFKRKVKLHPMLIVNDPIFSSGFASFAFKRKFTELLKSENIEIENEQQIIFPLTIINVSELQELEQSLQDADENIFNIIRYYNSITNVNRVPKEGSFIVLKTIEHAINKRIKSKLIANRIKKLTWLEDEN